MHQPGGWLRRTVVCVRVAGVALAALLLAALAPARVLARPLTSFALDVVGVEVQVGPTTQSVPKGVTSTVTTQLVTPAATIPLDSILGLLPQGLTVRGELSGPAFATPLTLSAPAGSPLTLPTLPLLGTYTLTNLRLVSGTRTSWPPPPRSSRSRRSATSSSRRW